MKLCHTKKCPVCEYNILESLDGTIEKAKVKTYKSKIDKLN